MPRPDTANGLLDEDESTTKSTEKQKRSRDPLIAAARTIARCVDFGCDVDLIVKTAQLIQQDIASKHGDLDEDDAEKELRERSLSKIPSEQRKQMLRTYYKLLQLVPGFKAAIEDPSKSSDFAAMCSKLSYHIKSTRSTDASHLKSHVPRYASPDPNNPNLIDPPIVVSNSRAELGLNHPVLARWICPAELLDQFDEDPNQACKDMVSGKIALVAEDFPALFWSGELPGSDFNPDRMFDGLFKSYFLVRVGRHIFLGPSHAIQRDSRRGRSNNASLHGMTSVEAEHIAYICVQARFAISSMSNWNETDGKLNYFKLYNCIVCFILSAPEEWRKKLYGWWNEQLFDNESGRQATSSSTDGTTDSGPRMSTMERMKAQMEACRAKEAQPRPALEVPAGSSTSSGRSETPVVSAAATSTESLSVARASTPVIDPSLVEQPGPSTQATSNPSSTAIPVTPTAAHRVTQDAGAIGSPLTDDDFLDKALTPMTNKTRTTTSKGKGKKRAATTDQGNSVTGESGPSKRPKRSRK